MSCVLGRYDFARSDTKVVMTTFHWHAHGVADVCFTTDGNDKNVVLVCS